MQPILTRTGALDGLGVVARHRAQSRRRYAMLGLLSAAIFVVFLTDIAAGPSDLGLWDVLRGLFAPETLDRRERVIVWDVRLPDALMALVVGAALGMAGAEAQTVLDNPLASPFTLGVSAAATLGAALGLVYGSALPLLHQLPPFALLPLPALLFGLASGAMVILFARFFGAGRDMIVLFGVSQFFLFQALIALLQLVADAEDAQQIVFWQVGDITRAGWAEVGIVTAALALTLPFSLRAVWRLTVLRTGEAQAAALGVDVERLRVVTVLRFSALTAIAVCFVGAIGFVGLVGPHLARLTLGEDHRFLTPGSALFGMLLLSLAALLAKLLIPGAITPVGVLTSIIGAPALIYLLILRRPS